MASKLSAPVHKHWCWLLVLAAALVQVVLAACISNNTHTSMQHCSAAALFMSWWLLVVADALVHQSTIIELCPYKLCLLLVLALLVLAERSYNCDARSCWQQHSWLQHSSSRAGCAFWQQHSYIDTGSKSRLRTLQPVLAARFIRRSYVNAAFLGCSTLQVGLAARASKRHFSDSPLFDRSSYA